MVVVGEGGGVMQFENSSFHFTDPLPPAIFSLSLRKLKRIQD